MSAGFRIAPGCPDGSEDGCNASVATLSKLRSGIGDSLCRPLRERACARHDSAGKRRTASPGLRLLLLCSYPGAAQPCLWRKLGRNARPIPGATETCLPESRTEGPPRPGPRHILRPRDMYDLNVQTLTIHFIFYFHFYSLINMPTHSKPWLESVYTAATGQRRVYGRGATLTVCRHR